MKNEKSTGSRAEYIEPKKSGQTIQKNVVQQILPSEMMQNVLPTLKLDLETYKMYKMVQLLS